MVNYVDIEKTLIHIDLAYSNSMSDPSLPILLSKTALIEFSGWIEQSMDNILHEYLDSHICENNIVNYIKEQIKKNYGFKYENNILKILSMTVGAYNLENILDKININLFQTLLDQYSNKRNNAAHTHIGTTTTYDAPSVILNDFRRIKPIVITIEQEIQSLP